MPPENEGRDRCPHVGRRGWRGFCWAGVPAPQPPRPIWLSWALGPGSLPLKEVEGHCAGGGTSQCAYFWNPSTSS